MNYLQFASPNSSFGQILTKEVDRRLITSTSEAASRIQFRGGIQPTSSNLFDHAMNHWAWLPFIHNITETSNPDERL
jgi:hypothetical protein